MKMGTSNTFKYQSLSVTKRLVPWTICTLFLLLPVTLLCLYLFFYPIFFSPEIQLPPLTPITITSHSSLSLPPTSTMSSEKDVVHETPCDYSNGEWIQDTIGPLYTATTCNTIKESEKCIPNGRPDTDYLYWKWKPSQCHLPRFEPHTFLQLIRNKHVAFVGDSLARNQLESLLCMLATVSATNLTYGNGEENKFRRWHFPSHNANFSLYWSPFLVQGVERDQNKGPSCNTMLLDHVNEMWATDIDQMDLIVISFANWFLLPAVYIEGGSVLGSLNCPELNHTEMDFYDPLRKVLRTSLNSIIERKAAKGSGIDVIVKTFSPDHFEGDWNKGGTCSKTRPYREKEKKLEGMDAEIRRIQIQEMENAKAKANEFGGFRLEALDVTKLALLRPDGHPGAYMNPFPYANGVQEHVQNDCVHWCLPGPIDTWNEILLEMMKSWKEKPQSKE
ncbi:hypothetical protein Lal_00016016 [Lupinus albus]|uniref:Putative PMR5 domain, PC-Esterase n=1 Tax=Lupinus albus TaxID=3870 RepID=A0A6A4QIY2_LUPAL|nr:putative PMR5 domain, PC-Esterase [Lupinus albus]KAF1872911.1 hypothetical protein Lal_00016016 [Lupinus albus]